MKTYLGRARATGDEQIVSLDEVCRLCLARAEARARVPIFGRDEPVPLALRIMACVALEMVEDDGLPNSICKPCHFQIEKYYVFRKKCESTNLKLRMHLKQLDTTANEDNDKTPDVDRPTNEQDLVGASVTIAFPEDGDGELQSDEQMSETEQETNDISLPQEVPIETREACTLKHELVEEDNEEPQTIVDNTEIIDMNVTNENETFEMPMDITSKDSTEDNLSVRVLPSTQGFPTHVEVTTGDGSVVVMELTTEETQNTAKNEDGELLVFKCEHCSKAFSRLVDLKRHSSTHESQRGITCAVCEKWFPSRSSYSRHERIHTGIKPYECGICDRKFVQKEVLMRHLLVHSEVKPYNCNVGNCKKGFTQREALRCHLLKHNDRRDVQLHNCPLCTKVFCHASGLSRHLLVHSGRMYKCNDCQRFFNDKSSLRRHNRITGHQSNS